MQVIIDTANTQISVKNRCFYIKNKGTQRQISPKRISSIAIITNCTINSSAIKLAANNQVPILFFNNFGTIQARLWSPYFINIAELRKKQLLFADSYYATEWVCSILLRKANEQINNLNYFASKKTKYKNEVDAIKENIQKIITKIEDISDKKICDIRNILMGYEGSISRHYFKAFNLFLPVDFRFDVRSRRPAMDYFNAALNYLYGMTYSVVESGVFAKGLDPFIGFLHTDSYRKTTLVFDLIEPIRPIIDKILIDLIMENKLMPEHFVNKVQGYWISKKGKRIIIPSFNEYLQKRIKMGNSVKRFKDHIYWESNLLGNMIDDLIRLQ